MTIPSSFWACVLAGMALTTLAASGGCSSSSTVASTSDGGGNPAGCPSASPPDKSACSLPAGTRCNYGCTSGGPSIATCTGSAWSVAQLEIPCEAPDASTDAPPPPADAPFACGSQTCQPTQYCWQPCCGGAPPQCFPMPDSGVCPSGTHSAQCMPTLGGNFGTNCQADPCTPPPPSCIDDPSMAPGCQPEPAGSRQLVCLCA